MTPHFCKKKKCGTHKSTNKMHLKVQIYIKSPLNYLNNNINNNKNRGYLKILSLNAILTKLVTYFDVSTRGPLSGKLGWGHARRWIFTLLKVKCYIFCSFRIGLYISKSCSCSKWVVRTFGERRKVQA